MVKTPAEYANLVFRIEQLAREIHPELTDARYAHLRSVESHLAQAAGVLRQVAEYLPLKKRAGK